MQKAQLGSWITTQRIEKSNGKLKPERHALLQSLHEQGKNHFHFFHVFSTILFSFIIHFIDFIISFFFLNI